MGRCSAELDLGAWRAAVGSLRAGLGRARVPEVTRAVLPQRDRHPHRTRLGLRGHLNLLEHVTAGHPHLTTPERTSREVTPYIPKECRSRSVAAATSKAS